MEAKEIIILIENYFHWLDVEKKYPNAGFAKSRKKAEQELRDLIKD